MSYGMPMPNCANGWDIVLQTGLFLLGITGALCLLVLTIWWICRD